jgi:hypothetical protein
MAVWVVNDAATRWLRDAVHQVALGIRSALERAFHCDQAHGKPMLISVMRVSDRLRESIPRSDLTTESHARQCRLAEAL